MNHVMVVFGARPEVINPAPVILALASSTERPEAVAARGVRAVGPPFQPEA